MGKHPNKDFIKADEILNPDGDLTPLERFIEIWNHAIQKSWWLLDWIKPAVAESSMLNQSWVDKPTMVPPYDDDAIAITSGNDTEFVRDYTLLKSTTGHRWTWTRCIIFGGS